MKATALALAVIALACSAQAQYCTEQVIFETAEGTITMRHLEARFNCCAWIDVEAVVGEFEIWIDEYELFEIAPCLCLCCFEAMASVSGLPPGDYTVTVRKAFQEEGGGWFFEDVGTWVVHVEGFSEPLTLTGYLPCENTAIPEVPGTWGTIKALYR